MFRIAALVAGALAGFVASLILALGGLEVTAAAFGGLGERQLALSRFGLIFIANLSLLGAGVTLAVPRAGAILLLLAGAAWAAAALYLGHSTDMVLFGPPALALLGFIFAIIGSFGARRPAPAGLTEPSVADYTPPDPYDVAPVAVRGKPAAALSPLSARDPLDALPERDFAPSRLTGRNERPPPPRVTETPTFRELDDDDEEEDYEPSFARRLGGGVASLLSFGLYAAAAASVLLVLWNVYQRDTNSRALVAETAPASSVSVAEVAPPPSSAPSSSAQPSLAPAPVVVVTPAPSSSLPPPVSVAATPEVAPPSSSSSSEPIRLVGEPPPANAAPLSAAGVSSIPPPAPAVAEPAPSSSEPPVVAVAETAPLPKPDFVDATKTAPVPATMSPELAAARRAGTFDNIRPDSFAIAPASAGSDI